jgi:hypothetical protein
MRSKTVPSHQQLHVFRQVQATESGHGETPPRASVGRRWNVMQNTNGPLEMALLHYRVHHVVESSQLPFMRTDFERQFTGVLTALVEGKTVSAKS